MNNKELAKAISLEYKNIFPNSYCKVSKGCLGDSYAITCYLGNFETWSNGISQNDQLKHTYWIHGPMDNYGKYTIECDGIGLMINPINKYLAMSRLKISYRKKKNTPEKLIVAMQKHFKNIR